MLALLLPAASGVTQISAKILVAQPPPQHACVRSHVNPASNKSPPPAPRSQGDAAAGDDGDNSNCTLARVPQTGATQAACPPTPPRHTAHAHLGNRRAALSASARSFARCMQGDTAAGDPAAGDDQDFSKGATDWGKPKQPLSKDASATEKAADKAANVMEDAAADAVQKLHPALIKFLNRWVVQSGVRCEGGGHKGVGRKLQTRQQT